MAQRAYTDDVPIEYMPLRLRTFTGYVIPYADLDAKILLLLIGGLMEVLQAAICVQSHGLIATLTYMELTNTPLVLYASVHSGG